jgi:hypothetical protein
MPAYIKCSKWFRKIAKRYRELVELYGDEADELEGNGTGGYVRRSRIGHVTEFSFILLLLSFF